MVEGAMVAEQEAEMAAEATVVAKVLDWRSLL